eukprot:338861-Chlamydomonas_euryale.AAC.1
MAGCMCEGGGGGATAEGGKASRFGRRTFVKVGGVGYVGYVGYVCGKGVVEMQQQEGEGGASMLARQHWTAA